MGYLQSFAVPGDSAVGVYYCRAKMFAGRLPDLGRWDDNNGCLNTKHIILLNEQS